MRYTAASKRNLNAWFTHRKNIWNTQNILGAARAQICFRHFWHTHAPATSDTISRCLKRMLACARVDTNAHTAHSTRSASTLAANYNQSDVLGQLCTFPWLAAALWTACWMGRAAAGGRLNGCFHLNWLLRLLGWTAAAGLKGCLCLNRLCFLFGCTAAAGERKGCLCLNGLLCLFGWTVAAGRLKGLNVNRFFSLCFPLCLHSVVIGHSFLIDLLFLLQGQLLPVFLYWPSHSFSPLLCPFFGRPGHWLGGCRTTSLHLLCFSLFLFPENKEQRKEAGITV